MNTPTFEVVRVKTSCRGYPNDVVTDPGTAKELLSNFGEVVARDGGGWQVTLRPGYSTMPLTFVPSDKQVLDEKGRLVGTLTLGYDSWVR
ncbi:hypothetical protein HYV64_00955 [Candidatus Shapirobacteria bacterium]|nr:hypothetical protein [Candidatus Shapirobacteria bacterium]